MDMFSLFMEGVKTVCAPGTLGMVLLGVVTGVLFGALPGVSAAMGVTLMLPFTYAMGSIEGVAFLVAVYCAAVTGGGITAILFRIPGTPSAAPTVFDGYPMAQKGLAGKALGTQLISSSVGGLFSAFCMFLLSKQLSDLALKFSTAELFAVAMLGLSVLTSLDADKPLKTFISGILGLFIATIGLDPILGVSRLTFGSRYLIGGVQMIPVMIGMFALTEVFMRTIKPIKMEGAVGGTIKGVKTKLLSWQEAFSLKWVWLRQAVLGTVVGILPGAGATIAAFLGYATEVKLSKTPEKFGTGIIEGVAAPETANNAATGGSMVPLLALGIPGGSTAAIIASALMMKGVGLGPLLLRNQPEYLSATFVSMIITNIVMVIVAIWVAKLFSQIIKLPYSILGPIILCLAMVGSFAMQNNTQNVMLMIIAGIAGLLFIQLGFSPSALILGLVLGNICETNLRRAVIVNYGSYWAIFSRPLTCALLILCLVFTLYPVFKPLIKRAHSKTSTNKV